MAGKKKAEPKLGDASGEPTLEYLTAFHNYVKGHKDVYDHIKSEIHLKARGSAGGKIAAAKKKLALVDAVDEGGGEPSPEVGMEKATNAAFVDGEIIETDDYIDAPTVFAKEGIFTGVNGIPTKKVYDNLKASANRFLGAPLTAQHLATDTVRPSDRWLGHIVSAEARDETKDIFGYSRYYKANLTDDEITKIREGKYPDGSIGYFVPTSEETGELDGKEYNAVEGSPYVITEYATFFDGTKGACSRSDGCGPFQNSAPKGDNVTDDISEKFEKLLNEAAEKMTRLEAEIVELKSKNEALEGAHKTLNEAFEAKQTADSEAKLASEKALFVKQLNAASAADPAEVEKMFNAYKAAPVEWLAANRKSLLAEVDPKKADGKQYNSGTPDAYAAAKAKTDEILFKRR